MNILNLFFNFIDSLFIKVLKLPLVIGVLILGTIMVLHIPFEYLFFNPDLFSNRPAATQLFKPQIINNIILAIHIMLAVPPIFLGPLLFSAKLRKSRPKIHRTIGKIYVIGCLLSAVVIVPLSMFNSIGTPARYGFTSMATIWFLTTYFCYTAAIHKDFVAHRRWAMRSYAVTFAFVHVNFTYHYLPFYYTLDLAGFKVMQSMVSWLSNLLLVEIYLASTTFGGKFAGFNIIAKNIMHYNPFDRFYFRFLKKKSRL